MTQFQQRKLHQCATGFGTVAYLRIHTCQKTLSASQVVNLLQYGSVCQREAGAAAGLLASRRSFPRYRPAHSVLHLHPPPGQASVSLVSSSCSARVATARSFSSGLGSTASILGRWFYARPPSRTANLIRSLGETGKVSNFKLELLMTKQMFDAFSLNQSHLCRDSSLIESQD